MRLLEFHSFSPFRGRRWPEGSDEGRRTLARKIAAPLPQSSQFPSSVGFADTFSPQGEKGR